MAITEDNDMGVFLSENLVEDPWAPGLYLPVNPTWGMFSGEDLRKMRKAYRRNPETIFRNKEIRLAEKAYQHPIKVNTRFSSRSNDPNETKADLRRMAYLVGASQNKTAQQQPNFGATICMIAGRKDFGRLLENQIPLPKESIEYATTQNLWLAYLKTEFASYEQIPAATATELLTLNPTPIVLNRLAHNPGIPEETRVTAAFLLQNCSSE